MGRELNAELGVRLAGRRRAAELTWRAVERKPTCAGEVAAFATIRWRGANLSRSLFPGNAVDTGSECGSLKSVSMLLNSTTTAVGGRGHVLRRALLWPHPRAGSSPSNLESPGRPRLDMCTWASHGSRNGRGPGLCSMHPPLGGGPPSRSIAIPCLTCLSDFYSHTPLHTLVSETRVCTVQGVGRPYVALSKT